MYFGNKGIHPSVMATLTEGYGVKKKVITESFDSGEDSFTAGLDLLVENAQIDEGLLSTLGKAAAWVKSQWAKMKRMMFKKYKINDPKFYEEFSKSYLKDPKAGLEIFKKKLADQGMTPEQIDAEVPRLEKGMNTLVAQRNNVAAGANGRNSKFLTAMANAHDEMQKAGSDPEAQAQAQKNIKQGLLGSLLQRIAGPTTVYRDQNVKPEVGNPKQPAEKPAADPNAATPPAPAQPAAAPAPAPQPAAPAPKKKQTITADGKFYDGQQVHVVDQNGQVTASGNINLTADLDDNQKAAVTDGSDYVVFNKGQMVGTETSHPWAAVNPKQSPAASPPKADPPRIKPGMPLDQSMANAPAAQPPIDPGQQPPPAAGAVPANPRTPPPAPPTTQNLANPNAPIQPAPVTKPAPSRAKKKPGQQP